MKRNTLKNIFWLCGLLCPLWLSAKIYPVSEAREVNGRTFVAGDTVILRNGEWKDQQIHFRGKGTSDSPVWLIAETPGQVCMRGHSLLVIDGEYLYVSGLDFSSSQTAHPSKAVVEFARGSSFCRLSETRIADYNSPDPQDDVKWISLRGHHHRVDHCTVYDKKNMGVTLVVWLDEEEQGRHRIDHNYFGPRVSQTDPLTGKELNGQETIRVGDSRTSLKTADCRIESNLFERCNGEIEVISNKSCGNYYLNNLFLECVGTLCLRHGHHCVVDGNIFLANGAVTSTGESGGVRVMGEGHRVTHNYFYRTAGESYRSALSLTKGNENRILNRYSQVKGAYIAYNTFVDCLIALDVAVGHAPDQPEPPIESIVECNFIYNTSSADREVIRIRDDRQQVDFRGNVYHRGTFVGCNKSVKKGFRKVSSAMMNKPTEEFGLYKPATDSELYTSPVPCNEEVRKDMPGRERRPETGVSCSVAGHSLRSVPDRKSTGVSWIEADPGVHPQ
ncbi:MAG: polysaccharide lyase 6 family protein [Bacteroides sp.]|nr:polysaccharide lyase 6 family protein [Bacteroides sp.]